jgi:hypothetical protein
MLRVQGTCDSKLDGICHEYEILRENRDRQDLQKLLASRERPVGLNTKHSAAMGVLHHISWVCCIHGTQTTDLSNAGVLEYSESVSKERWMLTREFVARNGNICYVCLWVPPRYRMSTTRK